MREPFYNLRNMFIFIFLYDKQKTYYEYFYKYTNFYFFHFEMTNISNNYESFLKILIEQRDKRNSNSNVYQIFPQLPDYKNKFNLFSIYEDSLEKEVRCPICLGRVGLAVRPSKCRHIFCRLCLEKWMKSSDKCPYCRVQFKRIIKVDIQDINISSQKDLFC